MRGVGGGGGKRVWVGGRLNITRLNKNCWSQMQYDLPCEVALIHHAMRGRAIKHVR